MANETFRRQGGAASAHPGTTTAGSPTNTDLSASAPPPASGFTPEQMAQIKEMMKEAFTAGAASVPSLPDDQIAMQTRQKAQVAASRKEHPVEYGELRHKQSLRDGTVIEGRRKMKDGEETFLPIPVEFRRTPEGKVVIGGPYDGKFL
jgi:hypothetical protein